MSCIYFGVSAAPTYHYLSLSQKWLWGIDFIHSYVRMELYGVSMVYQSNGIGVHFFPHEKFLADPTRTIKAEWRLDMDETQFTDCVQYCLNSIGRRFSNPQMFGLGIACALGLRRNPISWKNLDICSKTAGTILAKYAGGNFSGMDPCMYAPADYFFECIRLEREGRLVNTLMN